LCLPGSSVHPEAHKHIQEQRNDKIQKSKTINDATLNHGPKCRMTDEEKRRLDDIHKRLKDKKSKQREPKSKLDALAPYLSTNKQIRRVLQHNRNPIKIQMRSKRLEKYFLQNRREAEVRHVAPQMFIVAFDLSNTYKYKNHHTMPLTPMYITI
jgi:hypothetical protein